MEKRGSPPPPRRETEEITFRESEITTSEERELRAAKSFVFLTGLHFMADFRLIRRGSSIDERSSLFQVLFETAERGVEVFLLVNQFWQDESQVVYKPPSSNVQTKS